jgi:hypothetical protein
MSRLPSLRDLVEAPELVEVALACVALQALETVLVLERALATAAEYPIRPATRRRADRLIEDSRALRAKLRAYRSSTLRLARQPPPYRYRDF